MTTLEPPTISTQEVAWLKSEVGRIHQRNRQVGHADWCGFDFDFTCPSMGTYPFQWFWDSCFHAIALSHIDVEKAEAELFSLLHNQHPDGFVSHVTFWQRDVYEALVGTYDIAFRSRYLSDEMQPPLLAEAVQAVALRGRGTAFLHEILPSVDRFYNWLNEVRNPYGDGLIRVVQPDETGLDHSPIWDELLGIADEEHESWVRGWHLICDPYEAVDRQPAKMIDLDRFVVADVMLNTIYIENLRTLGRLFLQIGDSIKAALYIERAELANESLELLCWDEEDGLYYDVNGKENKKIRVNTVSSLMPILLDNLEEDNFERILKHILNPKEYWAKYPIPSVAMNHPSFRPDTVGGNLVWRGPTWLSSNWYLARGLVRHGRRDLAMHIAKQSVELLKMSGVREYYNPFTGAGHGANDFSWSTILLDLVVELTTEDK
jgi:glycogen debranching enzyme